MIRVPHAIAILLLAASFVRPALGQDPAEPPLDGFRFGPYEATIADLAEPAAVVIGADGLIYVAEPGVGTIGVFTRDGNRVRTIGRPGSGRGEMLRPQGLALLDDGTLFVADGGNHRIQVLDAGGAFVRAWGTRGTESGNFKTPRGLAVDDAHLYVADFGNDRVQIFDHTGRFVRAIGGRGAEDGRFRRPVDVTVDDAGAIYVADSDNDRIQKFDRAGKHVRSWGDYGPYQGLMDAPSGVLFRDGEIFVADTRNHRIQIFDTDGALRLQWGIHAIRLHEGEGRLHYPNALAVHPDGDFGVLCESFESRAQIFVKGDPRQPTPARQVATKAKQSHFGASLDVDGQLLTIAEPETHRLHLFDTRKEVPTLIGSFAERGTRFGQVMRAAGLAVDMDRKRLYVTDGATGLIQIFALDYDPADRVAYSLTRARFAKALNLDKLGAALAELDLRWPIEPVEITRGPDGELHVIDAANAVILVFNADLRYQRAWGSYGSDTGRFRRPTDLAFSRDGATVFVVDSDNHRVQAFDRAGHFQHAWGGQGSGAGQFEQAYGIAAGRDGFVYVTDAVLDRVQKFTEDGAFVAMWGTHGTDHGQFWSPRGIAQDDRLRVLVVDQGNHRAQIFAPDGTWRVTCGTGRSFTVESLRQIRERREQAEKARKAREQERNGGKPGTGTGGDP